MTADDGPIALLDSEIEASDSTMVFRRPGDEAMLLLPGRLEVIAGEPKREDIRFVGGLGERAQVTLGRESGPPERVVTLRSPTVSRRHARMQFVNGRWMISNLSKTNPVMVNDEIISSTGGGARILADGDTIELGEVVLRFRAR
jgi:pSer/pThr/pTyr-binding forkhead associated (FHA) protein